MLTYTCGGQYARVLWIGRPESVRDDASVDAYVARIASDTGPPPPGLEVGPAIPCRDRDGRPVVRVPFYGIPYSLYDRNGCFASTQALYSGYVDLFRREAQRGLARATGEGRACG
jgi:hypothetical protein